MTTRWRQRQQNVLLRSSWPPFEGKQTGSCLSQTSLLMNDLHKSAPDKNLSGAGTAQQSKKLDCDQYKCVTATKAQASQGSFSCLFPPVDTLNNEGDQRSQRQVCVCVFYPVACLPTSMACCKGSLWQGGHFFGRVCFASRITKETAGQISTKLSGRLRKEPGKNPLHVHDRGCDSTNFN